MIGAADSASRARLQTAFAEACYWLLPSALNRRPVGDERLDPTALRQAGWIRTRLGQASPALAARLQAYGVQRAQLLTACNPQGRPADPASNQRAMRRLESVLNQGQQAWLAGLAMAESGGWREPGCLLLGADALQAAHWAQEFDQAAWVEYDADGQGRLHWTADSATGENLWC